MTEMKRTIDLSKYREPQVGVISGFDKGKHVRERESLKSEDGLPGRVEVLVPEDILIVNPSFFLGLFGPSIKILGKDAFQEKYAIRCKDRIRKRWDEAIRRIGLESGLR